MEGTTITEKMELVIHGAPVLKALEQRNLGKMQRLMHKYLGNKFKGDGKTEKMLADRITKVYERYLAELLHNGTLSIEATKKELEELNAFNESVHGDLVVEMMIGFNKRAGLPIEFRDGLPYAKISVGGETLKSKTAEVVADMARNTLLDLEKEGKWKRK